MSDPRDLLADLIARARKAGADAADAVLVESTSLAFACRLGVPERLLRSESAEAGLRVFLGRRQAIVSSTDLGPAARGELVERALAMAGAVPEDPYCGLAEPGQLMRAQPELDLSDAREPAPAALEQRARAAEEAALAVPGVKNSEGAEASWGRAAVTLIASNGFAGGYEMSRHDVSVAVIAGSGTLMEGDHDYASAVHGADLEDPADVGRRAGERAVRRLNPKKPATMKLPVVLDPRVARGLLGHLAGAINGQAVARGTSFLKDRMGERVLSAGLAVIDDALRPRGLASRPFDGEGIAGRRIELVADGVLESWLLDLASARQLGLASTGHAARGTSSPPAPAATNLHLSPGRPTPAELMADIAEGVYLTELVGQGVNPVTGDYSRGAAGFWIVRGLLAHPVSEFTVAGNLKDMFLNLAVANDLVFRYAVNAPTTRIEGMTVAGV